MPAPNPPALAPREPRLVARLRPFAWGGALALWLLPAVAMRFNPEVDWGPEDFLAWGLMLLAACGTLELAAWRSRDPAWLAGALVAVGTAFLLLWANLAVGLIGGEDDPANAMYLWVLVVAVGGPLLARLRPRGVALAMVAAGIGQLLVPVVAGALGQWPVWPLTAGFCALWLAAAGLFMLAARRAPRD